MKKLIIGISGASGAVYGVRLLEVLSSQNEIETHLVMSRGAELTLSLETNLAPQDVRAMADVAHDPANLAAEISSGSFTTMGMAVAPCSMKSMAQIALGLGSDLLARAADVVLKERRKLVLVPRETPLNLSHIRHMETLTLMGGVVLPPVPSFYHEPKTIADIVDQTVGKVLDQFGIEHDLFKRWGSDG